MKIIISSLIALVLIVSCKRDRISIECLTLFAGDKSVSDNFGNPLDSNVYYFQEATFFDLFEYTLDKKTGNKYGNIQDIKSFSDSEKIPLDQLVVQYDTIRSKLELEFLSYFLYKLKEPVLYNTFLNKEIYRLTYMGSFGPTLTVSLIKDRNKIFLHTKSTNDPLYARFKLRCLPDEIDSSTMLKWPTQFKFEINETTKLSKKDYNKFMALINDTKINCMSPHGIVKPYLDGATWIFESHSSKGYHYAIRNSYSNDTLRILGDFLLDLSPAKLEKRY